MNRRLRTWWARIKDNLVVVTVIIILVTGVIVGLTTSLQGANTISSSQSFIIALISLAAGIFTGLITGVIFALIRRQPTRSIEPDKQPQKEAALRLSQQEHELEKQRADLENQQQILTWQMEATVLAEEDPQLAIVVAYQGLEAELRRAVNRLLQVDILDETQIQRVTPDIQDGQAFGLSNIIKVLQEYVGEDGTELFLDLRNLRNRIVHGEVKPIEISKGKATDYVQSAIRLTREISSIEQRKTS